MPTTKKSRSTKTPAAPKKQAPKAKATAKKAGAGSKPAAKAKVITSKTAPARKTAAKAPAPKKAAPKTTAKTSAKTTAKKSVKKSPVTSTKTKTTKPAPKKAAADTKPKAKKAEETKKKSPAPKAKAPAAKKAAPKPAPEKSSPKGAAQPAPKAAPKSPAKETAAPKPAAKKAAAGSSRYIYRPEPSVLDVPEDNSPRKRYSDSELQEFKDLILRKLESARKELVYLQGLITRKDEAGTDDTENKYMSMEDGSGTMEREQLSQLASRQIQYIDHLEKALVRIENKTYGICRVTGKLIDKARLRAVPHATLSIEAKQKMVK